jgi:hypothetical protein
LSQANFVPQLKVAYHSDGFIYPIIPDHVEDKYDVTGSYDAMCAAVEIVKLSTIDDNRPSKTM